MIRIAVGCAPNHEDAEAQSVFEWSVRKHASEPVEITWMKLSRDRASFWYSDGAQGWQSEAWATPFSAFRFGVPAFYGFKGKAIYSDVDVIFLGDVAELWKQDIPEGKIALAKGGGSWRYCVSLWDCKQASRYMPEIDDLRRNSAAYKSVMAYLKDHPELTAAFAGDWNCLDGEGHPDLFDGALKALHYTNMATQPSTPHAMKRLEKAGRAHWFNGEIRPHPRTDVVKLFDDLLAEAEANGYGVLRYIQDEPFGHFRKRDLSHYRGAPA